ncbi:CHAT domain-containing protein [Streptomyces sp. NPDC015661]|uniref:CHAT domain-containing protein n=1 Tax=Streptomyces sp. NPDC015661 TaxID=3364961 RepID=UPI0036F73740
MDARTDPLDEELRAEREELLDSLSRLPSEAPEATELCARVGEISSVLFARSDLAEDLELGAQAFELAFRAPGDDEAWAARRIKYAYVCACRHDREDTPDLLDRTLDLAREGLAGFPEEHPDYEEQLAVAGPLLAYGSKQRVMRLPEQCDAAERGRLIAESLEYHYQLLPLMEPGTAAEVDLREGLGYLHFLRASGAGGDPDDAVSAAGHYRACLDAALPSSDLPLLRHSIGLATMTQGCATRDRKALEEARNELGAALQEARLAGPEPSWAWDSEIRCAYIRTFVWANWKDHAQGAAAEADLNRLLTAPDALERLTPHYLDAFGRLLFERAGLRGDGPEKDRAIAMVRRAVDHWRPARDGKVTVTAFLLAAYQQGRYREEAGIERLHEVLRMTDLVLEDDELAEDYRNMTQLVGGWALLMLEQRHGIRPESLDRRPSGLSTQELDRSIHALFDDLKQGRTFADFSESDDEFPGLLEATANPSWLKEAFQGEYTRWLAMEPGHQRAEFALALLTVVPMYDAHATHVTTAQKDALIACVLNTEGDETWQWRAHACVAQVRLWEELNGLGSGTDDVMHHLARARDAAGPEHDVGAALDLGGIMATHHRGQAAGAADDMEAAQEAMRRMAGDPRLSPYQRRMIAAQVAGSSGHRALQAGDLGAVDSHLATMTETYADLRDDDPSGIELWTSIEALRMGRDELARDIGAPAAPPLTGRPTAYRLRTEARRLPRDHRAWVLGDNGIARCVRAMHTRDAAGLEEGLGLAREAHAMVDEGTESRLRYGAFLGAALCAVASMQPGPVLRSRHLAEGIVFLETAFRALGGPEHPQYASVSLSLARAYRTRGALGRDDRANGRRIGLDALRGHAWAALLQSGTDHAAVAAEKATSTALEVAAWCLKDNALEDAVHALDSCRGLVLHAAVTSRQVPERLVAAGHQDLADAWRAGGNTADPALDPLAALRAPQSIPSPLRRRVLAALTGADGVHDRLLDPPAVHEIGTALRSLRKDALIYLMPASDEHGGTAVVVTNGGDVHTVPLPRLSEDAAPLRDFLPERGAGREDPEAAEPPAGAGRYMGPVPGGSHAARRRAVPLREQLDRLCGWAWYAAVRPLFDTFATPGGRPPRLVLVPMGPLGLVPWHAAWADGADGRRYALQEAEISYAASARLLCEVASRTAVPHTGGGALVVGNPTGDLPYAGEEADAVQRAFYPAGTFLGRRAGGTADGPGTPDEVLSWLAESATDEGGVLHLACHAAIARDARRTAHLSLHGGDLAAEELTEAIGGGGGRLGLVVLAACRSSVSGRGHNEAYSLATAFLVAGARSVVGSLWPVPDDATSLLMFLTHHYLRTEGEPPAKALRRAQLWMLDPARELPEALPPLLAERARSVDPDDLSAWAGFTHLGQ